MKWQNVDQENSLIKFIIDEERRVKKKMKTECIAWENECEKDKKKETNYSMLLAQ